MKIQEFLNDCYPEKNEKITNLTLTKINCAKELTGELTDLSRLPNLFIVALSNNSLSGSLEVFSNLSNLEY